MTAEITAESGIDTWRQPVHFFPAQLCLPCILYCNLWRSHLPTQGISPKCIKRWVSDLLQLGKWTKLHIKTAQNLDIFENTGRLRWQHFIIQISPQLKCITVEMTKASVGFRTLLPPGCFPTPLSSARAACHASRAPSVGCAPARHAVFSDSFPRSALRVTAMCHHSWANPG